MPAPEIKLARGNSSLNTSFPGNSESQPAERPKLEPVVKGKVAKRKKSFLQKLKTSLLYNSDETVSVGDYILYDVLIPAIKTSVLDAVTGGIEMIFYGEKRTRPNNIRRDGSRSYVPYTSYYQGNTEPKPQQTVISRDRYAFEDIIFSNRGEAEEVLSEMNEAVEKYGLVTVADLYDLCNISHPYTDRDYGWTSLREAFTERNRDGYYIKFPRVKSLK